jgi:hypothetical protein
MPGSATLVVMPGGAALVVMPGSAALVVNARERRLSSAKRAARTTERGRNLPGAALGFARVFQKLMCLIRSTSACKPADAKMLELFSKTLPYAIPAIVARIM